MPDVLGICEFDSYLNPEKGFPEWIMQESLQAHHDLIDFCKRQFGEQFLFEERGGMMASAVFWNNNKFDYVNSQTVYYDQSGKGQFFFIVILALKSDRSKQFAYIQTHLKAKLGFENLRL